MTRVILCMIVKNEARTIVQTLESVLPYVHDAIIVDTGSTDETLNLCRTLGPVASHIPPGSLFERTWVDYSTNRNECLNIARDRACARNWDLRDTWLLMLDGDSVFEPQQKHSDWALPYRDGSQGHVTAMQIMTKLGTLTYPRNVLFRADADWKYRGKVHEAPVCGPDEAPLSRNPGTLQGCSIRYLGTDAGSDSKRNSWREHVRLLEQQRTEEQGANPRTIFYLAQTHECLGDFAEAARLYGQRVKMLGWEPERWEAQLRLGRLDTVFTFTEREELLLECTRTEPYRAEPWFWMAEEYAVKAELGKGTYEDWERAYVRARVAVGCTQETSPKGLFLRQDIYDYRADMLLAVCAYHTGRNGEAVTYFNRVLGYARCEDDETQAHGPTDAEVLLMKQHLATIEREERGKHERAERKRESERPPKGA